MAQVQIDNLSKSFRRRNDVAIPVLNDVSIHAEHSEFICLLGPSGCGKSTVLNVLAQLVEPDSGAIRVDGEYDYRKRTFGYVFQQPRLLNWMTVRENIRFPLRNRRLTASEIDSRVQRYLELVGLYDVVDEYPLNLSGGMQQRVGIARALAIEPDVLLMDEPFSSLDELTARTMRSELLKIWQETSKTIFFVTHNPIEAAFLADRIYVFSPRPTRVIKEMKVPASRPRNPDDPVLMEMAKEIVGTLLLV